MKKMTQIVALAALAAGLSACTSINTSDGANVIPVAKIEMPKYQAVVERGKDPLKTITGEASVNVLFGFISWGAGNGIADNSSFSEFEFLSTTAAAKNAAVYNGCQANNVDVILGGRYEISQTNYFVFKKVNCKVTGFPGKVVDVKEVK